MSDDTDRIEKPSDPVFDMSIYDKLEDQFDQKLASIGEGSSEEERSMTEPHDGKLVNEDVKVLIAKSKESSAAYYKEMLSMAKAGLSILAAAKG
jgi:hypothetical protein